MRFYIYRKKVFTPFRSRMYRAVIALTRSVSVPFHRSAIVSFLLPLFLSCRRGNLWKSPARISLFRVRIGWARIKTRTQFHLHLSVDRLASSGIRIANSIRSIRLDLIDAFCCARCFFAACTRRDCTPDTRANERTNGLKELKTPRSR